MLLSDKDCSSYPAFNFHARWRAYRRLSYCTYDSSETIPQSASSYRDFFPFCILFFFFFVYRMSGSIFLLLIMRRMGLFEQPAKWNVSGHLYYQNIELLQKNHQNGVQLNYKVSNWCLHSEIVRIGHIRRADAFFASSKSLVKAFRKLKSTRLVASIGRNLSMLKCGTYRGFPLHI